MSAVTIPRSQRTLHVTSEAVALFAVAPFMIWLSGQKSLEPWARNYAMALGLGTILVDGFLLSRYIRADAQTQAQAAPGSGSF
jgi:hypothetical protein